MVTQTGRNRAENLLRLKLLRSKVGQRAQRMFSYSAALSFFCLGDFAACSDLRRRSLCLPGSDQLDYVMRAVVSLFLLPWRGEWVGRNLLGH